MYNNNNIDSQDTIKISRRSQPPPQPQPQQQQPQQQQMDLHQSEGLDFVILMDITQSMQKYVDATLKSLKELIKQLQSMFNTKVKIGFLGYRDFEKENPGEQQFDYVDLFAYNYQDIDESKLYAKLNSIKCSGGGDWAEDVHGAILKSIEVMSWSGRQKYLILIADAPAHGRKYNGNYGDNYPDEGLEDALQLLIEKDIHLCMLEVSETTKMMVKELENYYFMQGRETFFAKNELNAQSVGEIAKKFTGCLCDTIRRNLKKESETLKRKQQI